MRPLLAVPLVLGLLALPAAALGGCQQAGPARACYELDPSDGAVGYVASADAAVVHVGHAGYASAPEEQLQACATAQLAPKGPGVALLLWVSHAYPSVTAGPYTGSPPC